MGIRGLGRLKGGDVYIHIAEQKLTQHCKAVIHQLKVLKKILSLGLSIKF